MRARGLVGISLVAALLGGCVGDIGAPSATKASVPVASPLPPVIAIIDSEINFYHSAFRSEFDWTSLLLQIPDATLFAPSATPDLDVAREEDLPFLRSVPRGSLVAFEGTRLMGVSMLGDASALLTGTSHGTSVAFAAANVSPHALVVVVQVQASLCDPGAACLVSETLAEAMEWVADQAWIDIVSLSAGLPADLPDHPAAHDEMRRFLEASKRVHDAGKIIVNAAANEPTLTVTDYFGGPPWVLAVGGFQGAPKGDTARTSRGPDVVANYTQYVARSTGRDAYDWTEGTSFAAPVVAGTLAEAMWLVRSQSGSTSEAPPRQAWRDALNATAVKFGPTDWSPTTEVANETYWEVFAKSVPVVFAPAQMGWGFVEAGQAGEIARRVIENDLAIPPEKAGAAQFQAQRQAVREEYWSRVGP